MRETQPICSRRWRMSASCASTTYTRLRPASFAVWQAMLALARASSADPPVWGSTARQMLTVNVWKTRAWRKRKFSMSCRIVAATVLPAATGH